MEQNTFASKDPMFAVPKKPFKWWILAIAVAAVAMVVAGAFLIYSSFFSPEAKLSAALDNTLAALSQRLESGPLAVLDSVDPQENLKTGLKLGFVSDVQTVDLMLELHTQPAAKRNHLSVSSSNKLQYAPAVTQNFSIYTDADAFAASIYGLDNGAYFGLEYASFREDLEKSALAELAEKNPEAVDSIETMLDFVQSSIAEPSDKTQLLRPYQDILMDWLAQLEFTTETGATTYDGADYNCDIYRYNITEAHIVGLTKALVSQLEQDEAVAQLYISTMVSTGATQSDARESWQDELNALRTQVEDMEKSLKGGIEAVFYVYGEHILRMELHADYSSEQAGFTVIDLTVELGQNAATDPVFITYETPMDTSVRIPLRLRSYLTGTEGAYGHKLELDFYDSMKEPVNLVLQTDWDQETGAMTLSGNVKYIVFEQTPGFGAPIKLKESDNFDLSLTLKREEQGFRLSFHETLPYKGEFINGYTDGLSVDLEFSCIETAQAVEKPAYVSLENWSGDLVEILKQLLGI